MYPSLLPVFGTKQKRQGPNTEVKPAGTGGNCGAVEVTVVNLLLALKQELVMSGGGQS